MPRLITFGCSYTYGSFLPDCCSTLSDGAPCHGAIPSKLAWPQLLGDMLGLEVVNKSLPGASNLQILYEILNFKFRPDDQVVIMWSLPNRDLVFTKFWKKDSIGILKPFRQLGTWMTDLVARRWITTLNEHDYCVKSWVYMQHAGLYLDNKNIKYIHYPANISELLQYKPKFINLTNLVTAAKMFNVDKAIDSQHPGVVSQQLTAKQIYGILCQD